MRPSLVVEATLGQEVPRQLPEFRSATHEPSSEGDERPGGVKRRARGSSSESKTRRRARRARTRRLQLEGTLSESKQRPRQAPRPAAPPPPPPLNIRAPKETKMRATFDPNYQTLAGLNNEDVFKPK
ncbi:hypothetical protein ANCDUO_11778, partial [Ancylostoma duodenale]